METCSSNDTCDSMGFMVDFISLRVDVIYIHDVSLLTLLNKSEYSWCCIVTVIDRMRCHWFIRSYLIDNRILDFHWVLVMCSLLESYSTCFLYSLSSESVLCYKKVLSWKLVPTMILAMLDVLWFSSLVSMWSTFMMFPSWLYSTSLSVHDVV